ncbi:hybrid sensor histidine kinase/response regulator [Solilutibacter silvestris]|uniref:histidine kinase n=1 Tax=Solilutibacter silvestris TaxID=1645665 RepID=A0A2K1PXC2_9GAMM|nr:hybrid sensor histidine kinase/response regulator [Lysobacter silvestris]PNS07440.1 Histidine kinase-, DNA gyrase B-, and HSP90-like ATPase [Lysobacter silvestris]
MSSKVVVALIAAVVSFAVVGDIAAQQLPSIPRMRLLRVIDGLPSNELTDIARDREGFIWMATPDGLVRYDGSGLRIWRPEGDASKGLPGGEINRVHVDARNRLWVGVADHGAVMLDAQRKTITRYDAAIAGFASQNIYAITSRGDDVWMGTGSDGLYHLDAAGRIHPLRNDPKDPASLPADTVPSLSFASDGTLWIGTVAGLARLRDGRIERVALPGAAPTPIIYHVCATGRGVWVGAASGVYYLDADGHWHTPFWSTQFQRPNAALRIVPDRGGELWIGSQKRLWHVVPGQAPMPIDPEGRPIELVVNGVVVGPNGEVWAGAPQTGLGYLRPDWRSIAELRYGAGALDLAGMMYRGIGLGGDGSAWLAGDDGDIERVTRDGRLERIPAQTRQRLAGTHPFSIQPTRDGGLWIGERNGLFRVEGDGKMRSWLADAGAQAPPGPRVNRVREAEDGSLWLLASGGAQQRDAQGRVLRTITAEDQQLPRELVLDAAGTPWAIIGKEILRVDVVGNRFVAVPDLRGDETYSLGFDHAGGLWVHRRSGLAHYRVHNSNGSPRNDSWRRDAFVATAPAGLPQVDSSALLVDPRGRVWLTTRRGLLRWDPQVRQLHHVGSEHGLQNQDFFFSGGSAVMGKDGRLVASTQAGTVVLVDTLANDPPLHTPLLAGATIEARRDGQWSALDPDTARLAPEDHEVRAAMHLLAYENPAGNHYWTRLDGVDRDWVDQGATPERIFTGLGAGRHRLRVRAQDAFGNPAREQQLHFDVRAPWWWTSWAKLAWLVCALVLLALGVRAWRRRRDQQRAFRDAEQRRTIAEEASLAKTRFLATLGHEIRTPMTGVLGMSELLEATPLDERQHSQVRTIRRAGEHLLKLVDDALDLARIEAGRIELADVPFDLGALVSDVRDWAAPNALRKGLMFAATVDDDVPPALRGDVVRVRQILLNLIGNAIKFTEQGRIELHVRRGEPQGVIVEVRDTGPGMNAEQQARLFRRFEQAEGARTNERYGGSGLGLAISQELASAMGGAIAIDSAPGAGARFRVTLPLPRADGVPLPDVRAATEPSSQRQLRLLMVEDDLVIAEVLAGMLQAQGHHVVHAPHGLAALTEAASGSFDAALLDLDLPGMDGFDLARTLRGNGFDGRLLAVTARADAEAETLARSAGFDSFLRKPVTGSLLSRALDALMR